MPRLGLKLVLLITPFLCARLASEEWRPLFENGQSDWETWLGIPHASTRGLVLNRDSTGKFTQGIGANADPLAVFRHVDSPEGPLLRVSGEIFGFIVTKEHFRNYHLRLQFKWGNRKWPPREALPRDSGLLYHVVHPVAEPGRSFPRSIEFQIQEGDVGDLYVIATRASARARVKNGERPVHDPHAEIVEFGAGLKPQGSRCVKRADFERPPAGWNTLELVCFGDRSWHIVNGETVMMTEKPRHETEAGWTHLEGGRIALQSEGAEVFFRQVEIRQIAAAPEFLSP